MKNLLIIGHTYPEPTTTAAGGRMMQLVELFMAEGYNITFATTAGVSERSIDLEAMGISSEEIVLNDPSFDKFLRQLSPTIVMFDRYITEEQFGWRVAEHCANALRILDTEDLHFLRKARHEAVKKGIEASKANIFTETAKRELASILRCDLSLIISEMEMNLLQHTFKIPRDLLFYLPFLVDQISGEEQNALPDFEEREHFITVGNLFHAPNVDAVVYLKKEIWPLIRKQLPKAELHVYGAYAPKYISEMHQPKDGFYIEGWVENIADTMSNARVCLAPIRFGAGLKGKLFDAMLNGTPFVTTSIGSEGILDANFSRNVADDIDGFVQNSVKLYSENHIWKETRDEGFKILESRFQKVKFSEKFKKHLKNLLQNLEQHRTENFIGQILQHQSLQATKYMSKWIEEKGK